MELVSVLSDWPQPNSGSPEPLVLANDTQLVIRYFTTNEKIAVIIFPLCSIFKFGSPNDEALNGHPLSKNGLKYYSVHKVENSLWISQLEKQNSVHPRHNTERFFKNKHHYIFTFQDSTLELIANEGEFWKPAINVVNTEDEAKKIITETIYA